MKNKPLLKRILLLLALLFLLGSWAGILYDYTQGDANGVVAGFSLQKIGWVIARWVAVIYLIYRGFASRVAWLQNALIFVLFAGIAVWLLEVIFGFLLEQKMAKVESPIAGPIHSMVMDSVLGYKPAPLETHLGIKTRGRDTVYSIQYQTDAFGLRQTPMDSSGEARPYFAQFYGCSMTFGEGVQSYETMPYYFGQTFTTFRPYNLAYSGYSPAQALARLESGQARSIIPEKEGVGFFVYIPDHINRVVSTMSHYAYNQGNAPYYRLEQGKLAANGLIKSNRRWVNLVYDVLLKSNLFTYFQIGLPWKLSSEHIDLTAEVLAATSQAFQKEFPAGDFYVILYPTTIDNSDMKRLLQEKGVKVLDYSKLFNPKDSTFAIPYDEHPTPYANRVLIEQLKKDLKLKN